MEPLQEMQRVIVTVQTHLRYGSEGLVMTRVDDVYLVQFQDGDSSFFLREELTPSPNRPE